MNGEDIERAGDACDVSMGSLLQIDFLTIPVCWSAILIHRTDWVNTGWLSTSTTKDDIANIRFLWQTPSVTFRRYLDKHCVYWSYNDVQLQSVVSRFCGHYCVRYCILRSRGIDMRSSFTRDTGFNDVLVHGFVCVQ